MTTHTAFTTVHAADSHARWARTWVEIDPEALKRNFRRFLSHLPAPQTGRLIACVKKEGYGHGLETVARALANEPGLGGYAVATIEEALHLRDLADNEPGPAGEALRRPMLLTLVPLSGEALEEAIRRNITLTVTCMADAEAADKTASRLGMTAHGHFKLDTGMGRIGLLGREVIGEFDAIRNLPNLRIETIFSHLADAWNDPAGAEAQWQRLQEFRASTGATGLPLHWGGSDGVRLAGRLGPADAMRVGIAMYGDHPSDAYEPAMTFKSRVIYRRSVPAATPISYGGTFVTSRPTELALVGAGYGNGLPRALSGRGQVLLGGVRCPILGRVCMDQIAVDVTDAVAAGAVVAVGDEAVLFGKQGEAILTAADQAQAAGTISYELFCLAGEINPHRLRQSD